MIKEAGEAAEKENEEDEDKETDMKDLKLRKLAGPRGLRSKNFDHKAVFVDPWWLILLVGIRIRPSILFRILTEKKVK